MTQLCGWWRQRFRGSRSGEHDRCPNRQGRPCLRPSPAKPVPVQCFASVCLVMFVSGQARVSSLRVRSTLRRYPASRGGRRNQRCLVTDHPSATAAATLWLSGRKQCGMPAVLMLVASVIYSLPLCPWLDLIDGNVRQAHIQRTNRAPALRSVLTALLSK